MMKETIGIFGGSFDPVHVGHLMLARDVLEALCLTQILFVPAARNPLKTAVPGASSADRVTMLQRAVAGREGFGISLVDVERPPPSYAIDTVEALRKAHPKARFIWLIGEDQLAILDKWHRASELAERVDFVVLRRPGMNVQPNEFTVDHFRLRYLLTRRIEVGSTEIRERIRTGKPVDFFLPDPVIQWIEQNSLYKEQDGKLRP